MRSAIFCISFFILLGFYCLVISRFGFENWDSGFVQSFSWRILNGENAYRDFIYIRPPVSVYFHALFMKILPLQGQHFYFRVTGYLLFALQVFLTVSGTDKLFDFKRIGIDKWGLIFIGFILSMHNFFGNPWFTTDGVLFASAAYYLMARFKKPTIYIIFFIALFSVLSALTKQSFYFVPIVFGIWIWIDSGFRKASVFALSIIICLSAFWIWLSGFTDIQTILAQISGHTKLNDLYQVGFMNYIQCYHNRYILLCVLVIPFFIAFFSNKERSFHLREYFKWLSIVFLLSAVVAIPVVGFLQSTVILFNAVVIALIYKILLDYTNIRKYFPLIVLIVIAYCAGLSLGYPYPVFYVTGLISAFIILMSDDFKFKKIYTWLALPISIWVFAMNEYPYREASVFKLDHSLETVSPKLKYIYSDKPAFDKYNELKQLIEKYGNTYIVAPSSPLSHYLFDTKNPIQAEWLTNFEINDKAMDLLKDISEKKIYIFVEKSFLNGEPLLGKEEKKEEFSLFANYFYVHCRPLDETEHFLIYYSSK